MVAALGKVKRNLRRKCTLKMERERAKKNNRYKEHIYSPKLKENITGRQHHHQHQHQNHHHHDYYHQHRHPPPPRAPYLEQQLNIDEVTTRCCGVSEAKNSRTLHHSGLFMRYKSMCICDIPVINIFPLALSYISI